MPILRPRILASSFLVTIMTLWGYSCKSVEHAVGHKRSTVLPIYEIMRKYGCMEFTTIVAADSQIELLIE